MEIISDIKEMQKRSYGLREKGHRIGFVPTMGFLHRGHSSLMEKAREENDALVVSIFVNPTQFGPGEDYEAYPRDVEKDQALCQKVGTDLLFSPSPSGMYPSGFGTAVSVSGITEGLCGASRPGHFDGVCTVVAKLLNIVCPHRAYFGLKDYQQFQVVRRMARDLDIDTEIVGLPTVREPDGLAMSSRNAYLTPGERKAALTLFQALQWARKMVEGGILEAGTIEERVREMILSTNGASIDYVSVVDAEELSPVKIIRDRALLALAVRLGKARLIDNIILEAGNRQSNG
ncbi:MAG: pantoate--beta-alanine ligase [Proteobacteria bacterium]|nr:pantoate--beta-alanine ligase [Pseudomonadota bacterium]